MTARQRKIAGLLLAAGGSTRLGQPKQLLEWKGKTLIRRAAEALLGAGCDPVVVVVGSMAESCRLELDGLTLEIVENTEWRSGMSSSIRSGLESLLETDPHLDAVLITLVDQPKITKDQLKSLLDRYGETSAPIVAAEYDGVAGVPALFDRRHFPALSNLTGDKGARDLIRKDAHLVAIPLPEAGVDIDTLADLEGHP